MPSTPIPPPEPIVEGPLHYLPVALFGSVMGLTGLSSAWRLAETEFGAPDWIHQFLGALAVMAFIAMAIAYGIKLVCSPAAVRAEFKHPIAGNLFGTVIICFLLLPGIIAPVALQVARTMWTLGAVALVLFAWLTVDRWIDDVQLPEYATPAWIVPVVGLLDLPLAMPALDLPPQWQVMKLMGLGVGFFFAVPLFTLILSRLLFQPPLPPSLQPVLMILLAPFSVGVSAYLLTVDHVDMFAKALYLLSLFMFAVLVGRLRYLVRCCPFRVSWWAVSFPLASMAIAALRMCEFFRHPIADAIAWGMLALATGVVAWLAVRTLFGMARGELKTLTLAI